MQSLVECHNIAKDLKYDEELAQYKKLPDGTFEEMKCDANVMNLIEDLPVNKIVDLYMVRRSSDNWKWEIYEITHSLNWDDEFGDFWIGQLYIVTCSLYLIALLKTKASVPRSQLYLIAL
ncbi:hypothetical protein ACFX13_025768 [Malus domestica]